MIMVATDFIVLVAALLLAWLLLTWFLKVFKATVVAVLAIAVLVLVLQFGFGISWETLWHKLLQLTGFIQQFVQQHLEHLVPKVLENTLGRLS